MSVVAMLVVGVILLIVAYTVTQMPPPLRQVLTILGWILVGVGLLLLVLGLLGLGVGPAFTLR